MINEYEGKAIERLVFFAKDNGANVKVSRNSGVVRFDFGDIVFQFQGTYRVDMLCYNKEKRAIMKRLNLEFLSKEPLMAKYKKPFFGILGGGMYELRCAEWLQLEEVVKTLMTLFVNEFREQFLSLDEGEYINKFLYRNIGEHLIRNIEKSCK